MSEFALPMNQEAEQSVIGAMLIERKAALTAMELLTVDDFALEKNRVLFSDLSAMLTDNKPLDLIVVRDYLRRKGHLESIGGALYLQESMNIVPSAAGVAYYSGLIQAKALQRRLITLGSSLMDSAQRGDEDLNALLQGMYSSLDTIAGGMKNEVTVRDAEMCAQLAIDDVRKDLVSETQRGIPAPLASMQSILKPIKPGQLIVLAGRPGMGKSALALQWAWYAAAIGKRVLYYSLEMSHAEMGERLLNAASAATVDQVLQMAANLPSHDEAVKPLEDASTAYHGLPLFISYPEGKLTPERLMVDCRLQKLRTGLDFVVVDYLGLMSPNEKRKSEYEENTALVKEAKIAARALNVPFLAVQQLNRATEDKSPRIPQMKNLKGTGQYEQDVHAAIFLYRPGYYASQDGDWRENDAAGKLLHRQILQGDVSSTAIMIQKQRRGRTGTSFGQFLPEQQWFADEAATEEQQETAQQAMGYQR